MPKREGILLAGLSEHCLQSRRTVCNRAVFKIKTRKRSTQRLRCVLKIRNARTHFLFCRTDGAGGNKRFMACKLESYPAQSSAQEPVSGIIHMQGINTS